MTRLGIFLVTLALVVGMGSFGGPVDDYNSTPSQNLEIRDWYDLDAIRNNLGGNHTLMSDLDSTTAGYEELASPTANQGKGWQPIGFVSSTSGGCQAGLEWYTFAGTFDGQGYEIRDLFINRPDEGHVGLFGHVDGVIKDIGVVNVTVIGDYYVGGLVGFSAGNVSNSYSIANVTGGDFVGGLVGNIARGGRDGTVSNSYSTGNVIGQSSVGGLVGRSEGTVSNSYSTGNVSGQSSVGGLVGINYGIVSNTYSSANVTGGDIIGGLVGRNEFGTVSNSYSTGNVTGSDKVGGLVGWNAGGTVSNSYSTGNVIGQSSVGGLVGYSFNPEEDAVTDSFWDTETSGQATSDGGTGKTTAEMQDIATFSDAAWDIVAVANPGTRNPSYIWNIVNGVTYPFLGWQL